MSLSLLGKLKGLIIEEDPPAPPAQVPPQSTGSFLPTVPTGSFLPTLAPVPIVVNQEKLQELRLKVHPTTGPLVVFFQTLTGLVQFIPDEITRFRAALSSLSGQGITADSLIGEINTVVGKIETNRGAAEAAKNNKYETEVTARENRVTEIGKMIEAKQAEIADLVRERDQVFADAQAAKTKIDEKWAGWEAIRLALVFEYTEILRKLQSYIPNTGVSPQ